MMIGQLVLATSLCLLIVSDCTSQDEVVSGNAESSNKDGLTGIHENVTMEGKKSRRSQFDTRRRQNIQNRLSRNKLTTNSRGFRVINNTSKDSLDILEAEETRQGIYVTDSDGNNQTATTVDDEESKLNVKSLLEKDSMMVKNNLQRGNKNLDESLKRKNTVVMTESLYNHFRPVESNIPVEDMSQFLYFGKKIQHQPDNTMINNTVDGTATFNLRRRKGTSTVSSLNNNSFTTISANSKLDEMMNDEINVTVDKMTVDNNSTQKVKSRFRNINLMIGRMNNSQTVQVKSTSDIINEMNLNKKSIDDESTFVDPLIIDEFKGSPTHRINIISTQIPKDIGDKYKNEMTSTNINDISPGTTSSTWRSHSHYDGKKNLLFKQVKLFNDSKSIDENTEIESSIKPMVKNVDDADRISTLLSINSNVKQLPVISENYTMINHSSRVINPTTTTTTTTAAENKKYYSSLRIVVTEATVPGIELDDDNNENIVNTENSSFVKEDSTTTTMNKASPSSTVIPIVVSNVGLISTENSTQINGQGFDNPHDVNANDGDDLNVSIINMTSGLFVNYSKPGSNEMIKSITTESTEEVVSFPPLPTKAAVEPPVQHSERTFVPLSFGLTTDESSTTTITTTTTTTNSTTAATTSLPDQTRKTTILNSTPNITESNTLSSTSSGAINLNVNSTTVRWNPKSSGTTEKQYLIDRKYLRKSGSNVGKANFNSKISDELMREFKRRRSDLIRRYKGEGFNRISSERFSIRTSDNNNNNEKVINKNRKTMDLIVDFNQRNSSNKLNKTHFINQTITNSAINNNYNYTDKKNNSLNNNTNEKLISDDMKSKDDKISDNLEISLNETVTREVLRPVVSTSVPVIPMTSVVDKMMERNSSRLDYSKKLNLNLSTELPEIISTTAALNPELLMTTDSWRDLMTSQPKMEITTTKMEFEIGGERSREVRGRNLSDKSKDKDDVLPIMHLYNTSNMFNGTEIHSEDSLTETTLSTSTSGHLIFNVESTTMAPSFQNKQKDDAKGNKTNHYVEQDEDGNEDGKEKTQDEIKISSNEDNKQLNGRDQLLPESKDGKFQNITTKSSNNNKNRQEVNHKWSNITYNPPNKTKYKSNNYYPSYNNSNNMSNSSINSSSSSNNSNKINNSSNYYPEMNGSLFEPGMVSLNSKELINVSEVIKKGHDGSAQETIAVVSYILATLVVFPIAVGVGLILRRLIIRNRKVLEESDTSSEISCRKDALNLENGDFKTSIEKAITKLPRIQHLCHDPEKPPNPPPPAKQQQQESKWEFPRDKLRLQTVLGQGNFGQVWKAEADDLTGHKGTTRLVAVKTVKEGASAKEKEDLVRELEIMQQLGNHPNVVTLLGCCTEQEPHYLILEYVMYGKLLAYLRDHRTRQDFYNFSEDSAALTSRDLTVFGYCVARGMEYLSSKKIIHRDLAARNVLVDHNKLCKIADFGMSRFANEDGECIETRHERHALPIRWMAPESLIYSLFTSKTDVWSFGILMWEIVTLGSTPYPDMAAREVMRNVQSGYRLERPSHCRSELFRVISRCWHADPNRRPEFQVLRRDLAQLLEDNMNGHYVDLESFASECND